MLVKILTILTQIPPLIVAVERILGSGRGAEKKSAVIDMIRQSVMTAENITAKDIVDNALFDRSIEQLVEGTFGVLKATGKFKL